MRTHKNGVKEIFIAQKNKKNYLYFIFGQTVGNE